MRKHLVKTDTNYVLIEREDGQRQEAFRKTGNGGMPRVGRSLTKIATGSGKSRLSGRRRAMTEGGAWSRAFYTNPKPSGRGNGRTTRRSYDQQHTPTHLPQSRHQRQGGHTQHPTAEPDSQERPGSSHEGHAHG